MTEPERRRGPRWTVGLPVVVRVGGESARGQLRSVSRLGGLLESEASFPVGTSLELGVELPGDRLEVWAQVIRAETLAGVQSLAILFSPLALPALTKLEALLATSSPEIGR